MSEPSSLQQQITPHWTKTELDNILFPTGNVINSDEKIQRDELKQAIEQQSNDEDNLRSMLSAVVRWDNKEPAIALWAGQIETAVELANRNEMYESAEAVEVALIERFAQPVYTELEVTKPQLVEKLAPIICSSPITNLRPEVWGDRERALEQIREVLDEHVENKLWENGAGGE